jgi:hypothetical protein
LARGVRGTRAVSETDEQERCPRALGKHRALKPNKGDRPDHGLAPLDAGGTPQEFWEALELNDVR